MHTQGFFGDLEHTNTFHTAGGAREILADGFGVQANRLEQLRAAVAHVGGHTHLRHDLGQALANRLDVVVDGFVGRQVARQILVQVGQGFHREVGVHGFCAVTGQHGEVVHFAGRTGFHHQTGGGAQAFAHQVLVDGAGGQQCGDGHLRGLHVAVTHDQDVGATLDGVHRFSTQRSQLGFDTLTAPVGGVSDVERAALELALGVFFDVAQLGHVGKVQNRLRHFEPHGRVDLVDVQQVRLGTDEAVERHHDRFTDRVDRRVGHLREHLAEVVVQRLVLVAEHGQRAVVAHGANAFFAIFGHGRQQELDVFLREAKSLLPVEQRHVAGQWHGGRRVHAVELDTQVLDPLLVGFGVDDVGFQLFVVDHAALFQVDHEHLAGLQAPLAHNFVLRDGQHAGLGRHDHQVVVGHAVARGAQAVAVECGADLAAVGEHDRCGAVPRLHHRCVVFVERAAALVHVFVLFPGLGNHHHHGLADRVTGHGHQLEAVVERGGVGLACKADGVQLLQIVGEHGRRHHAFAGLHPVVVATHRVDFAVVGDITVRVGQGPLGEGVGREALVHQANRRNAALVGQVEVVHTHLVSQQQAFVDHGAAGHTGNVILLGVFEFQVLDVGAGRLADHVELAFQRVLHDDVVATANEDLAQDGLGFAHGGGHRHVLVDWHIAPAQQHLAFGLDGAFHLLFAGHT